MVYDYSKLNGKIIEVFGKQSSFAKAMNLSERTLSLKLCNKRAWKQEQMLKAMDLLGEEYSKVNEYFFKKKVQCIEHQEECTNYSEKEVA